MSSIPFRAVSFQKDDVITRDGLNQVQNNLQVVMDNAPRGRFYRVGGEPLDVRTVVVCGKRPISKNKAATVNVNVKFPPKVFGPKCWPHVTTGIVSDFQRRIFCVVNGPGHINYPNASGFQIRIHIAAEKKKKQNVEREFFVHWHALGWRQVGT